jgi:hypothetical protein
MFFQPLIDEWGLAEMAGALCLPVKNIRSWRQMDSIPGDWFVAVAQAARKCGRSHITEKHLAALAAQRRLARNSLKEGQGVAA